MCYEQTCKRLKKSEALLRVEVVAPGGVNGSIYLDGTYRAEGPWEKVVEPGAHEVRVEARKQLPYVKMVDCPAREVTEIKVALQRDPSYVEPPPPAPPPPPPKPPSGRPGTLLFGLYGGGGIGTAQWGDDGTRRPAGKGQLGAMFGGRALDDPVWLDLAAAVSYSTFRIKDPPGADSADLQNGWTEPEAGAGFQFAVQARLLVELDENFLYVGGELEPGYILSEARYAYAVLSPTLSVFVNEWVELRLNPIGFEWIQELTGKGFVALGFATAGVAFRFLDL